MPLMLSKDLANFGGLPKTLFAQHHALLETEENICDDSHSDATSPRTYPEKDPSVSRFKRNLSTALKYMTILVFLAISSYNIIHLASIEELVRGLRDEHPSHPVNCGHTKESAKAAGCVYDIMMVGWVAPGCIDPYVLSDALSPNSSLAGVKGAGTFNFSLNYDFTELIPQDVDVISQHDWIFTNWEFHKAHCAYVWRILASALERKSKGEKGVYIYRTLLTYEHSLHCSKVLLDREKSLLEPTKMQAGGTNRCVLL